MVVQRRDLSTACREVLHFPVLFASKVISISLLLNQSWAKGISYAFDIEKSLNKAKHILNEKYS